MALLAVSIWVVSPGTVFFRQERVGYRGRRFQCLKFRTMTPNADPAKHRDHLHRVLASGAMMQKMDALNDSRLIPGGALLRATGLDELPQLLNVLRGEMSLVGPRPCIPYEFEHYTPAQRERFNALPGLTGLWQVSGKNRTTFEEMLMLDIYYVRHQSVLSDIAIILRTPGILLQEVLERLGVWQQNPPARALKAPLPS